MKKETRMTLELLAEGKSNYAVFSSEEAQEILADANLRHHYHTLSERITDALDKVRAKRYTGEPARSDAEEIEALVREVLRHRRND